MTFLIAPIAPPAAGKSYLVRGLVADGLLPESAVICPDHIREVLTGNWADQSANRQVFEMAHSMLRSRLGHGFDAYMDATNLLPSGREELREIAASTSAMILWVRLPATVQGCLARNAGRAREVPVEPMRVMCERYAQVDWLDLGGQSTEVLVDPSSLNRILAAQKSRASTSGATVRSMN